MASRSQSDVLVVDRTSIGANGPTRIAVRNVGGGGELTPGNGILVVDTPTGGSTQPGTFSLAGPVLAGPYEYSLFRSGINGSTPQSWYLRSTLPAPPEPTPPEPTPPGPTPPSPTPPPPSRPGPPIANVRAEVSLFAALPAMAALYGTRIIDTLHERVGELYPLEAPAFSEERTVWCKNPEKNYRCTTILQLPASAAAAGSSYASAGWARILAHHGERDGDGILGRGPSFDYDFFAFQAGLDLYRRQDQDGSRDHGGVYFAIGRGEGDVEHSLPNLRVRGGSNEFDGYTLGGYWTHFGPSGWYLDSVLQGTWYDFTTKPQRFLETDTDGFGLAASLETGYPIQLGNGVVLEPQAQLIYQTLNISHAQDIAAVIRFRNDDFLTGRVGARLAKTWALDEAPQPRLMTGWLRANVWHEFLGNSKTEFSSQVGFVPFRADLGGTWGELGAGISAQVTRSASLFANANYQRSFDGDRHGYEGKIGLRYNW